MAERDKKIDICVDCGQLRIIIHSCGVCSTCRTKRAVAKTVGIPCRKCGSTNGLVGHGLCTTCYHKERYSREKIAKAVLSDIPYGLSFDPWGASPEDIKKYGLEPPPKEFIRTWQGPMPDPVLGF